MAWVDVAALDHGDLVRCAERRALVRLRNGRIATLVRWRGRDARGASARCATAAGTKFTVRCDAIDAVLLDPA